MGHRTTVSGTSFWSGRPWAAKGLPVVVAALLAGCATPGWRVPAPPVGATKGDLDRCEPVAMAASRAAERGGGVGTGVGLAAMSGTGIVFAPVLGLGFGIAQAVQDAAPAWRAYETAMATCVAPEVLERKLGPDHPDVAVAYAGEAELFAAIGDAPAALWASERAVAIEERAHGPEHRATVRALEGRARLLRRFGQPVAADQVAARVRLVREQRWPRFSPAAVDLGAAPVDRQTEAEIQIVNPGSAPLALDSVTTTDLAWSAELGSCAAPVPPGGACSLLIRVVPRVPGAEVTAELVVTTTTTDELRARLTATGRLDGPLVPLATVLEGMEMVLVPAGGPQRGEPHRDLPERRLPLRQGRSVSEQGNIRPTRLGCHDKEADMNRCRISGS